MPEAIFADSGSCCGSFSGSNRQIKQVNLTFEQNFIVLPVVERSQSNKPLLQTTPATSSKLLNLDYFRPELIDRKPPPPSESPPKQERSDRANPSEDQLKIATDALDGVL
jgi:hypothetical protein